MSAGGRIDYRDLTIECLADDVERLEHSRRELIALLVELVEETLMWRQFADQQFRKRVAAEGRLARRQITKQQAKAVAA